MPDKSSLPESGMDSWRRATEAARDLLDIFGDGISEESRQNTPGRMVRSLSELTRGMGSNAIPLSAILDPTFPADGYDELILVRHIPFASLCEHHILPFVGEAAVGYIPKERIVGISKLARLVQAVAARATLQERMTTAIADTIEQALDPLGVMVVLRAEHTCMTIRGCRVPGAETITSVCRGYHRDQERARNEFLHLAGF